MSRQPFEFIRETAPQSEFERSLDDFCVYDIAAPEEKKSMRAGAIAFNVFRYGLLATFLCIFAYCIYSIASESAAYFRADQLYSDLAMQFESDEFAKGEQSEIPPLELRAYSPPLPNYQARLAGEVPEQVEVATSGAVARAKIAHLKELNPDAVAWIMIDGTGISLPVVQGTDNSYYLDYAFDRTKNWTGTLFVDCMNSAKVTENYNYVIYGHNMEGGQMFNNLTKFLEEDFFYANRYITLYSDEGIFTYEIYAVFRMSVDDRFYYKFFSSDQDFCDFMYEMKYNSLFLHSEMEFTPDDRIITLSTCTNENQRERYAVQAKMIKHEP